MLLIDIIPQPESPNLYPVVTHVIKLKNLFPIIFVLE